MNQIKVMMVDDEPIIRKAVKMELNARHAQVECLTNDDGDVETKEIVLLDTFASGPQMLAALSLPGAQMPDYVLIDMEFQGEPTGGIFIADRIRKQYKNSRGEEIKLIILSGRFDNPLPNEQNRLQRMQDVGKVVFESLRHGVNAFVSKNAVGGFSIENIVRAIACLERGEKYYFNYPVMLTIKEAAQLYFENLPPAPADLPISAEEKRVLLLEAAGCTAQEISQELHESDKSVQERQRQLSIKFDVVNKSGCRIARAIELGIINPSEIKYLRRS